MAATAQPQQEKTLLMTEGSIWKSILLFSVPLILGNLLQQLYNTADSIIVGNFLGSNALAAVGSSGSPIYLLIGFSQGVAVGAGVVVSQYLGAKDKKETHIAVHTSLAIAVILGLILTGIAHYDETIHQTALAVLCRDIFGRSQLPMARKHAIFVRLHKKLLTLLSEPRAGQLTFFNCAAMLNHLYRYTVRQELQEGPFRFLPEKPAAFFPGTFDPFSVGHKQIVQEIRARGFEVYLAVDEFSWSKKTLPKLLRRRIVSISVADQWDTYLFPDDIPVNIAMPDDLSRLQSLFAGRELYLVAGSDVIANASAYKSHEPGTAADYKQSDAARRFLGGRKV